MVRGSYVLAKPTIKVHILGVHSVGLEQIFMTELEDVHERLGTAMLKLREMSEATTEFSLAHQLGSPEAGGPDYLDQMRTAFREEKLAWENYVELYEEYLALLGKITED